MLLASINVTVSRITRGLRTPDRRLDTEGWLIDRPANFIFRHAIAKGKSFSRYLTGLDEVPEYCRVREHDVEGQVKRPSVLGSYDRRNFLQ